MGQGIFESTFLNTLFFLTSSDQYCYQFKHKGNLNDLQQELHHANLISLRPNQDDESLWRGQSSGAFSVKSAYFTLKNGPRIKCVLSRIWKLNSPPRFKVFAGLLTLHIILSAENLKKRGFALVTMCYLCRVTLAIYEMEFNIFSLRNAWASNTQRDFIKLIVVEGMSKAAKEILFIPQFVIWSERRNRIFRGQSKHEMALVEEVHSQWQIIN